MTPTIVNEILLLLETGDFATFTNLMRLSPAGNPICSSKEPIKLLEQGVLLHIRPGEATAFQGQLQETKVTNYFVEEEDIINITTREVSVIQ